MTLTTWKLKWCCCRELRSCYCSPTFEEPIKNGLLQMTKGCRHWEIVADLTCEARTLLFSWRGSRWARNVSLCHDVAIGNTFMNSFHLSKFCSGPKTCDDWLKKTLTSGLSPFWESSRFVPWFGLFEYRDYIGTCPEWTRACRFGRKWPSRDSEFKMRHFVPINSWDSFFLTLPSYLQIFWHLSNVIFLISTKICASSFVIPRIIFMTIPVDCH